MDERGNNGDECEGDAGAQNDAERAELEAGAVCVGRPWCVFVLPESEDADFRDKLEHDGHREHQHGDA